MGESPQVSKGQLATMGAKTELDKRSDLSSHASEHHPKTACQGYADKKCKGGFLGSLISLQRMS